MRKQTIKDAYIAVEIEGQDFASLREGLRTHFGNAGVGCDAASSGAHISIAYGEGDVALDALERVASEIAALPFSARVESFDFLQGSTTPFDYLVVNLTADECFCAAVEAAQGCMKTKSFSGGFRSHVSLLKFPKGTVSRTWAKEVIKQVINEMNICQTLAHALGRQVVLQGAHVNVFGGDRAHHVSKFFQAA